MVVCVVVAIHQSSFQQILVPLLLSTWYVFHATLKILCLLQEFGIRNVNDMAWHPQAYPRIILISKTQMIIATPARSWFLTDWYATRWIMPIKDIKEPIETTYTNPFLTKVAHIISSIQQNNTYKYIHHSFTKQRAIQFLGRNSFQSPV